jgi:hypothetical protein
MGASIFFVREGGPEAPAGLARSARTKKILI